MTPGSVQLLLAHRVLEHRRDGEVVAVEWHGAGFEPGEVEQLGDQAAEPLDLGEHRQERVRIGRGDPVDDVLERGLQRGERGAQLVAHVGDEVPAHPVRLAELRRHPVERTGEPADLVARGVGDAPGVVALGHRLGCRGHLPQRGREPAGYEAHEHERDHRGRDAADARPEPEGRATRTRRRRP